MKRVTLTSEIETLMRNAFGPDIDLANAHVYEAIALNTLPLRKRHPLYLGSRADRSLLHEMAAALSIESRPVHVEHAREDDLPMGRVFYGTVRETGPDAELRVLFTIDGSESEAITKVENGTVDQVSVSILPKQILNSVSGFDYIGPDSDFDNVMTGTDPDGNTLNENGVYARLVGLDAFYEMSLVGQGGAQNARIVRRDQSVFGSSYQKLAASGVDPNALVLTATVKAETEKMDLKDFIAQLDAKSTTIASLGVEKAALEANVATLTSERDALQTRVDEMGDVNAALSAKDAEIATLTESNTAAVAALQDVAKVILTAANKPVDELPSNVAELSALIETAKTGLAAVLVAGGKSKGTDSLNDDTTFAADLSAFSTRK